jgi:hypothetical protein
MSHQSAYLNPGPRPLRPGMTVIRETSTNPYPDNNVVVATDGPDRVLVEWMSGTPRASRSWVLADTLVVI